MGQLTRRATGLLVNHIANDAYTPVATVYLGFSSTAPTAAATGSSFDEVDNTGAYARTAITFGAAASRAVTQTGVVGFATATTSWTTAVSWAICNTSTYGTGDVLAVGSLSSAKRITANASGSVASGEVTVSFVASGITDNAAHELLDHMFRNATFTTTASSTYVALATTSVSDLLTGASITENSAGYARILVRPSGGTDPTWDTGSTGTLDNATSITFATATANWDAIVAVAVATDATSGVLLLYNNDITTATVNLDDVAQFPAGDLDLVFT